MRHKISHALIHILLRILRWLGWPPPPLPTPEVEAPVEVLPVEDPEPIALEPVQEAEPPPVPALPLPESLEPHRAEMFALVEEERCLRHGSTDILGDDWLRFRRIASRMKKATPDVPTHDIFQAILTAYKEMDNVQT